MSAQPLRLVTPWATVHNLYREPMDRDTDVYVGRAGKGKDGYFGNPFRVGVNADDRTDAVAKFDAWAEQRGRFDPIYRERVKDLNGRRLFCFCPKDGPCHAKSLGRFARLWAEEDATDGD